MINKNVKKVLVIGSGPIVIGQAAEFDYAGTQACRSLREEGVEVVLVNSNPSTIMTDVDIADRVYIEPITLPFVTEVIKKERPDALLATLGGQVGLNMAVQLSDAGVLEKYHVKLLGSSLHAIKHAEDRELFKEAMEEIHQPVPESDIFEELEPAVGFADKIGYPVIIRPAYTLGGTGGGIAHDRYEMEEIANRGIKLSPINQILVERSIAGWKEVEFEVMRDSADNCIIVCAMENIDPVGVHTGDSIVVAPTQTLTDGQYQMLRTASINIIRYLQIEGGCNVQYGLDTKTNQYYVIEVNPRVSRSSALASKATGYPIAKVAAKIALGMHLDEITNAITGNTKACFEPSIDYVVCKFPRWPFEKFTLADREIGTQMKATGEVMALDRTLEGALLKALRSLEVGEGYLHLKKLDSQSLYDIRCLLKRIDNERIFVVAEALRRGIEPEEINRITRIDLFFIYKIQNIIKMERRLLKEGLTEETLKAAKRIQMPDEAIAHFAEVTVKDVENFKKKLNFHPDFKMVDTCAAEFEAHTPYYYSTYEKGDEMKVSGRRKVIILGGGPNRIVQGITKFGFTVSGMYGERNECIGNIFQITNQITLGVTETDILDQLRKIVTQIVQEEQNCRSLVWDHNENTLKDKWLRTYGTLSRAWLLADQESLALASDLRFGIDMGVIPEGPLAYEAIMTVVEPAYLQLKAGTELNGEELEHQRSEAVQQVLSAYRRK